MNRLIKKLVLMLCLLSIFIASIPSSIAEGNQTNATVTPTVTVTATATPTIVATTPAPTEVKDGKFRQGPTVRLRPVNDIIEPNQDGIVELFMVNPSLNEITLNVDASVSVPSGIHVYGESFGLAAGAGQVYGTFSVPPGTGRTISVVIKADKSARIGSHTLQFTGSYWPGDNKDNYQQISLTYPVTVNGPSKDPDSPEPSQDVAGGTAKKDNTTTGGGISTTLILLVAVVLGGIAIIIGLGRRPPKTEVNVEQ